MLVVSMVVYLSSVGLLSRNNNSTRYAANLQTTQTPDSVIAPLELQRCLSDDAVANKDVDLLIWLAALYVGALLLSAGIKLAIRIQRVLISVQIVHMLRRSVFYCIYTIPRPRSKPARMAGML
jgi:hypothetical protein